MNKSQVPPNKKYKRPSSKSATFRKRLIFLGIVIITLFALYLFGKQNDLLGNRTRTDGRQILLKESIATKSINSVPEVHKKIIPPFQTAKRRPVSLYRWFSDDEGSNKNYDILLNFIQNDGWEKVDNSTINKDWAGKKTTNDGYSLHLTVTRVGSRKEYAGETINTATIVIRLSR